MIAESDSVDPRLSSIDSMSETPFRSQIGIWISMASPGWNHPSLFCPQRRSNSVPREGVPSERIWILNSGVVTLPPSIITFPAPSETESHPWINSPSGACEVSIVSENSPIVASMSSGRVRDTICTSFSSIEPSMLASSIHERQIWASA